MIANSYPYGDMGYSLVEYGKLNKQTLGFDLQGYLVVDKYGEQLPGIHTQEEARALIDELMKNQSS